MAHTAEYTDAIQGTVDRLETEATRRIIKKLDDVLDFPDHFLDRLRNHPGYKLRVGEFCVLIDRGKNGEVTYAIDVFERKKQYRELRKHCEVRGSWLDD